MTFIYELGPYTTPWRYTACAKTNFLRQGFRKLSSDRQTDTTITITHAASWVVKIQNLWQSMSSYCERRQHIDNIPQKWHIFRTGVRYSKFSLVYRWRRRSRWVLVLPRVVEYYCTSSTRAVFYFRFRLSFPLPVISSSHFRFFVK